MPCMKRVHYTVMRVRIERMSIDAMDTNHYVNRDPTDGKTFPSALRLYWKKTPLIGLNYWIIYILGLYCKSVALNNIHKDFAAILLPRGNLQVYSGFKGNISSVSIATKTYCYDFFFVRKSNIHISLSYYWHLRLKISISCWEIVCWSKCMLWN